MGCASVAARWESAWPLARRAAASSAWWWGKPSGLPWQGVEIHEPLRLLFVIEATPQEMISIMERHEVVGRILRNGWAQLAVLDPHGARIQVWHGDGFRPYRSETTRLPTAASSFQWYRGWREHLEFALIES